MMTWYFSMCCLVAAVFWGWWRQVWCRRWKWGLGWRREEHVGEVTIIPSLMMFVSAKVGHRHTTLTPVSARMDGLASSLGGGGGGGGGTGRIEEEKE